MIRILAGFASGLTQLNADLMLANCTDAVGPTKDVNRLKNFMEAFLATRKGVRPARKDEPVPGESLMAIDASPTDETAKFDVAHHGGKFPFYDANFVDDADFPTVPLSLSFICLICKAQQAFDDVTTSDASVDQKLASAATQLIAPLLDCIIQYGQFCVSGIMNRVNKRLKGGASSFEVRLCHVFVFNLITKIFIIDIVLEIL